MYDIILEKGVKLKFITEDNNDFCSEITEVIDENNFKVKDQTKQLKMFLYGSYKDDFNVLNKEYINSVHVSASQQLHRMIKKQDEIINNLISRIEALEQ